MDYLILTGWFWKDYAVAAAVALRHYKKADILGSSTHRLPEILNEIGCNYKEIAILGVGLTNNIELLEKALIKLKTHNVKVRWISSIDFPPEIGDNIKNNLDYFICKDDGITEATSQYFKVKYDDIAPLARVDVPEKFYSYKELIEAAMYFKRNFQDEDSFGRIIYYISKNNPETQLGINDKKMLECYRRYGHREISGRSEVTQNLHSAINKVAPKDRARVFIYGESGTGKETIATLIHLKSPRKDEPFYAFNCASVTPNLLEDKFFGHEKGAFTGANEQKKGLFELANGGTLFLDEIGEMPLEAQGILLRVLEGGRFTRTGGFEEISTDIRLVTATNKNLASLVKEGKFREDLYHRLCVVQINAPSLKDHKDDIKQIADSYLLKNYQTRLTKKQLEDLKSYDYPGNVRELLNILERAMVLEEDDFSKILAEHKKMTSPLIKETLVQEEVPDDLESVIKIHVKKVFDKYDKNLTKTADALQVARNTVRKYLD